jgi:hypothetical protein
MEKPPMRDFVVLDGSRVEIAVAHRARIAELILFVCRVECELDPPFPLKNIQGDHEIVAAPVKLRRTADNASTLRVAWQRGRSTFTPRLVRILEH